MNRLVRLFGTSIGRKAVVAATGALLTAFLLVHAAGNLLILKGPDALNGYADWLQGHPLLWVFRAGLLALIAVHVTTTVQLTRQNRAARPLQYRQLNRRGTGLPGRLMPWSGLAILVFVVFHLLHLTLRWVGPEPARLHDAAGRIDVHALLISGFSHPFVAGVYLVAIGLLALHLVHALQGMVQTIGFNHESYQPLVRGFTIVISLTIAAGFASIPLLVLSGMLGAGGG
ncbi:MAG: succinate dehydrogenase cytochrome b subunit [Gammaproteobacteria bacterium]|nr:succinate dehydrogenase cytochrome b subunit [Gammaproteobacteria bacterium]